MWSSNPQYKHKQHVSGLLAGDDVLVFSAGLLPAASLLTSQFITFNPEASPDTEAKPTTHTASMTLIITTAEPLHICGSAPRHTMECECVRWRERERVSVGVAVYVHSMSLIRVWFSVEYYSVIQVFNTEHYSQPLW